MAITDPARQALLRRGFALEYATLAWNVAGIVILAIAAAAARSVALAGFGLDSLIEVGASTVVLWELFGSGEERERRALRLIGGAFVALAAYLSVQSLLVLVTGYRPGPSVLGTSWTVVTAVAMFALAAGKARTGRALGNPVLITEGRATLVDGILAVAVLAGLVPNAAAGGPAGRPGHRVLRAAGGAGDLPGWPLTAGVGVTGGQAPSAQPLTFAAQCHLPAGRDRARAGAGTSVPHGDDGPGCGGALCRLLLRLRRGGGAE
jgi:hypothetical protein